MMKVAFHPLLVYARNAIVIGASILVFSSPVPAADTKAAKPAESPKADTAAAKTAPAKAGSLTVTSVSKEGDKYSATFNGNLVMKGLEMKDGKLFFPKTEGKGDRAYPVVYLDDRTVADLIKEAIKANKATGQGKPADLKVTGIKYKEHESGKLHGFADITFNNAITVKGCKLLDSKNGLWLAWPSVKKGKEYDDLVFLIDKDSRDKVFEAVKKEAGVK